MAVRGFLNEWPVFLRAGDRMRPLGQLAGTAYATLATGRAWDVAIGHPIVASDSRVVIGLVQTGDSRWQLHIHNPTDVPIPSVWIRPTPRFLIAAWPGQTVDLPPGSSLNLSLETTP